jgi:hypothetical protein
LYVLSVMNVFFLLPSFLPLALNRCGSVFPLDSLRNLALREMSISQQPNKWRQESVGCLHFQRDYYPVFLSLLLAACSEVSAVTDERCQQRHCCYGPVCFLLSWSLATKQEKMYVCMCVCMYVCTQGVLNDCFQLWSFYLVSGVVWILEWKRVPSSDASLVQRSLHFVMSEMWYIPHIPLGRRIWHCFLRNSRSS